MSDIGSELRDVLRNYGEYWQIQQDSESNVWTAIRRLSPTALHIVVAHDLPGLAAKLEAAESNEH
jgi:hypothetical protein